VPYQQGYLPAGIADKGESAGQRPFGGSASHPTHQRMLVINNSRPGGGGSTPASDIS